MVIYYIGDNKMKSRLTNKERKEAGITQHGMRLEYRSTKAMECEKGKKNRKFCRTKDKHQLRRWE